MYQVTKDMIAQVRKAIVGKNEIIEKVWMAILARGHVLLEAMEEGKVTIDGQTHSLPSTFVVLATQKPVGSAGS